MRYANLITGMAVISLLAAALIPGSLLCHCPGHDRATESCQSESSCQSASAPAKHSCCAESMKQEESSSRSQGMTPGCHCGEVSNLNPFLPKMEVDPRLQPGQSALSVTPGSATSCADPGFQFNRTDVRAGPPGSPHGCTITILRL